MHNQPEFTQPAPAQRSLNLSILRFKHYSEDIQIALKKFEEVTHKEEDSTLLKKFNFELTRNLEQTRKSVSKAFKQSIGSIKDSFQSIFGDDFGFSRQLRSLAQKRRDLNQAFAELDSGLEENGSKVLKMLEDSLDLDSMSESSDDVQGDSTQNSRRINDQTDGELETSVAGSVEDAGKLKILKSSLFQKSSVCESTNKCSEDKGVQVAIEAVVVKSDKIFKTKKAKMVDKGCEGRESILDRFRSKVWKNSISGDIVCDHCHMDPLVGIRFKCKDRKNYDLCEKCFWETEYFLEHDVVMMAKRDKKDRKKREGGGGWFGRRDQKPVDKREERKKTR